MSICEIDAKGRITLPKKDRERTGITKKVLVLNAGDHLKIIPLPHKSLDDLKGSLSIPEPFTEMRKEAERLAIREANRKRSNASRTPEQSFQLH
ncbi:MAG: division/cell wall cluster transcriptional repressor MraZ [Candidatus Bathyarchaeota archaeon]